MNLRKIGDKVASEGNRSDVRTGAIVVIVFNEAEKRIDFVLIGIDIADELEFGRRNYTAVIGDDIATVPVGNQRQHQRSCGDIDGILRTAEIYFVIVENILVIAGGSAELQLVIPDRGVCLRRIDSDRLGGEPLIPRSVPRYHRKRTASDALYPVAVFVHRITDNTACVVVSDKAGVADIPYYPLLIDSLAVLFIDFGSARNGVAHSELSLFYFDFRGQDRDGIVRSGRTR